MHIGIDLDNTIINYNNSFDKIAKKLKLIENNFQGNKEETKLKILKQEDGQKKWEMLQGQVYGKYINTSEIFSGFQSFLWKGKLYKAKVSILSHKTVYGHYDKFKINLRDAAYDFLNFNEVQYCGQYKLIDGIYFFDTKEEKINFIKVIKVDFFIDDLIGILKHKKFPSSTRPILFDPFRSNKSKVKFEKITSWHEATNIVFSHLNSYQLKNILKISNLSHCDQVTLINKGGNSKIYKIIEKKLPRFTLKIYPEENKLNRITAEYDGFNLLRKHKILNVPKPILKENNFGFCVYNWISGKKVTKLSFKQLNEMIVFIRSIKQVQNHKDFENFPNASASCFSGTDILNQLELRRNDLLKINNKRLNLFIVKDFDVSFKSIISSIREKISNYEFNKKLDKKQRLLSPSDFGYHNLLKLKSGKLIFLDFEYFGWDDPVKLISDFLFHPAMIITKKQKLFWLTSMLSLYSDEIDNRINSIWTLYGLCWVLIMLKDFDIHVWKKRNNISTFSKEFYLKTIETKYNQAQELLSFLHLNKDRNIRDIYNA